MTLAQKYVAWAAGILVWIFSLSILLSYASFGYLDPPTVRHMVLVISPLLILAATLLFLFRTPADAKAKKERVTHRVPVHTVTEERT